MNLGKTPVSSHIWSGQTACNKMKLGGDKMNEQKNYLKNQRAMIT